MKITSMDELDDFDLTWSSDTTKSKNMAQLMTTVGEGVRVSTFRVKLPSSIIFSTATVNMVLPIIVKLSFN